MPDNLPLDALTSIRSAHTIEDLWTVFQSTQERLGVAQVHYFHIARNNTNFGIPNILSEHSPDSGWSVIVDFTFTDYIDTIFENCTKEFDLFSVRSLDFGDAECRKVIHNVCVCPDEDAIYLQVFGPGLQNACVGVVGLKGNILENNIEKEIFRLLSQSMHARFVEIHLINTEKIHSTDLSPRERQVLGLVAQGKSNSVIAEIFSISPNTVDAHLRRIFRKLSANDRTSAALKAVSAGLIQP